jgi:hypothetical protein
MNATRTTTVLTNNAQQLAKTSKRLHLQKMTAKKKSPRTKTKTRWVFELSVMLATRDCVHSAIYIGREG